MEVTNQKGKHVWGLSGLGHCPIIDCRTSVTRAVCSWISRYVLILQGVSPFDNKSLTRCPPPFSLKGHRRGKQQSRKRRKNIPVSGAPVAAGPALNNTPCDPPSAPGGAPPSSTQPVPLLCDFPQTERHLHNYFIQEIITLPKIHVNRKHLH